MGWILASFLTFSLITLLPAVCRKNPTHPVIQLEGLSTVAQDLHPVDSVFTHFQKSRKHFLAAQKKHLKIFRCIWQTTFYRIHAYYFFFFKWDYCFPLGVFGTYSRSHTVWSIFTSFAWEKENVKRHQWPFKNMLLCLFKLPHMIL